MATVQDYLNMAVSMSIGNKSGTDNYVYLPDDLRKFKDLKVTRFKTRTVTVAGGVSAIVERDSATDSIELVFFSHPVKITAFNATTLSGTNFYTSFVACARNMGGTAAFQNNFLSFHNSLHTPNFIDESSGATQAVDILIVSVELGV